MAERDLEQTDAAAREGVPEAAVAGGAERKPGTAVTEPAQAVMDEPEAATEAEADGAAEDGS
ncbi:MAG TPA: hypothetical protein VH916_13150, partial [Dehalococcoidia bacterium]